jgi:transposase
LWTAQGLRRQAADTLEGGGPFEEAVRGTIETDPALSHALLPMLEARQMLLETFLELDRRVRKAANQDAITIRFMGVPSVGYVTALSFKAAVDDPARFKSSRTVGAYFGLTLRRFQSGEKDNPSTGRRQRQPFAVFSISGSLSITSLIDSWLHSNYL